MYTKLDRLTELAKEATILLDRSHGSRPKHCMQHSEVDERKPAREWTASRMGCTKGTLRETSKLFMRGSRVASIRLNLFAQGLYPQGKREAETALDSRPGGQRSCTCP